MASVNITREQLRSTLVKNWMTHDALWYGEVAARFGMAEASPINLKVCRKLGRIEFGRLIKMVGASPPRNMSEYRELFELGKQIFFPDFMEVEIDYPSRIGEVVEIEEGIARDDAL